MPACPRCARENAAHRATCLYCGAAMPNPTAPPPPPVERALPENFDALFQKAMAGQGVSGLKQALMEQRPAAKAPPPPAPASAPPPREPLPQLEIAALTPLPAAAPADEVTAGLASARRMLDAAEAAWAGRQPGQARARIQQIADLLPGLLAATAPAPAPTPERGLALVIACPGDAAAAPRIAAALQVDAVTARMLAMSRHPRLALRDPNPATLAQLAERYQQQTGCAAAIVPPAALAGIRAPLAVVEALAPRRLRVSGASLWLAPDPTAERYAVEAAPTLAVPGEVVTAQYRSGPQGYTLARELRVGVLDLHGPGVFLRITEDVTDFKSFPGYVPSSARRSFGGLTEGLGGWYSGIELYGPRICRPAGPPTPPHGQTPTQLTADGWAAWEEHSRFCRILGGVER